MHEGERRFTPERPFPDLGSLSGDVAGDQHFAQVPFVIKARSATKPDANVRLAERGSSPGDGLVRRDDVQRGELPLRVAVAGAKPLHSQAWRPPIPGENQVERPHVLDRALAWAACMKAARSVRMALTWSGAAPVSGS